VALIAPEMVVFTAFQQWFAAKTFLRKLNAITAETANESNLPGVSAGFLFGQFCAIGF
jgi:hypothetical protein